MNLAAADIVMFRVTHEEISFAPMHNKKQIRNTVFTISQLMVKLADFLKVNGLAPLAGYYKDPNYEWVERVMRYLDPTDSCGLFSPPVSDWLRNQVDLQPQLLEKLSKMDYTLSKGRITTIGLLKNTDDSVESKHLENELKKIEIQKRLDSQKYDK
jgi:hypothetical protein